MPFKCNLWQAAVNCWRSRRLCDSTHQRKWSWIHLFLLCWRAVWQHLVCRFCFEQNQSQFQKRIEMLEDQPLLPLCPPSMFGGSLGMRIRDWGLPSFGRCQLKNNHFWASGTDRLSLYQTQPWQVVSAALSENAATAALSSLLILAWYNSWKVDKSRKKANKLEMFSLLVLQEWSDSTEEVSAWPSICVNILAASPCGCAERQQMHWMLAIVSEIAKDRLDPLEHRWSTERFPARLLWRLVNPP